MTNSVKMAILKSNKSVTAMLIGVLLCLPAVAAPPLVSLPSSYVETVFAKARSDAPDSKPCTRVQNLIAAHHYDEAYKACSDFVKSGSLNPIAMRYAQEEWGLICEMLGKYKEAYEHFEKANDRFLMSKSLIETGDFGKAKECLAAYFAEKHPDQYPKRDDAYAYSGTKEGFLQLRAAAEVGLNEDSAAVADLTEAAMRYRITDSSMAEQCIADANKIMERSNLGQSLSLETIPLPGEDRQEFVELIKFLTKSRDPFERSKISSVVRGEVHLRGHGSSFECKSKHGAFVVMGNKKRRVAGLLWIRIKPQNCFVSLQTITDLLPNTVEAGRAEKSVAREMRAETNAYPVPSGMLVVNCGTGKEHCVEMVWLSSIRHGSKVDADSTDKFDTVDSISKALLSHPDSPALYVERARELCALKRYGAALFDAKKAVQFGGKWYLSEQSTVEEAMGDLKPAIADLKTMIDGEPVAPETAPYFERLAALYLKSGQFAEAAKTVDEAIPQLLNSGTALFTRAKAQLAMKQYDACRRDAEEAVKQLYNQADIIQRDEINEWLKKVPAAEPKSDESKGSSIQ